MVGKKKKEWKEKPLEPVSRRVREVMAGTGNCEVEIDIAPRYRKRWTDEECEIVIQATPEEYPSYYELAEKLERSPGAIRLRKDMVIRIFQQKDYAIDRIHSGEARYHDWFQMYAVMKNRGYLSMPENERLKLARHLKHAKSSWRGDNTQRVLKGKKDQDLLYSAVRKLLKGEAI